MTLNNMMKGTIVLGVISLLILTAFISGNFSQTVLSSNDEKPITIESSASLEKLDSQDLDEQSKVILIGTVKEILPSKWNTPDGMKPKNEDLDFNDEIYTDIIISVNQYVKNPLPLKEVTVRVHGGTVGNDTMSVDYEPSFKAGEKVLLYLSDDTYPLTKDVGSEHFVVTGFVQGKYSLMDNGQAFRMGENVSLEELLSTIEK